MTCADCPFEEGVMYERETGEFGIVVRIGRRPGQPDEIIMVTFAGVIDFPADSPTAREWAPRPIHGG